MDDQTAKQLMGKAREADAAFDQIVEAHWGVVFRVCDRIVRNEADAEEITLETFYRAREAEYEPGVATFQGWLCKIASNLALDLLRKRKRDAEAVERAGNWVRQSSVPAGTDLLFWSGFRECLAGLTETQRLVFLLSDMAGLGVDEIARILDQPPGNIRSRRSEARKHMSACLETKGITMGDRL